MPCAPEGEGGVIVRHATDHVLRGIDAVRERPETEETPGEEKFEPNDVKVEVAEHAQLERSVDFPGRLGFGDGDGVDKVKHYFHA